MIGSVSPVHSARARHKLTRSVSCQACSMTKENLDDNMSRKQRTKEEQTWCWCFSLHELVLVCKGCRRLHGQQHEEKLADTRGPIAQASLSQMLKAHLSRQQLSSRVLVTHNDSAFTVFTASHATWAQSWCFNQEVVPLTGRTLHSLVPYSMTVQSSVPGVAIE